MEEEKGKEQEFGKGKGERRRRETECGKVRVAGGREKER